MREITLILPYYLNPEMFRRQQAAWRELPADVRAALHVIVVDDGSPERPAVEAVEETGVASFRLYRIGVDVRWNWLACRNLGVDQAATDWLLLTDMDHVVPAETWRAIMTDDLDPSSVYRFSRVDAPDLVPYKPHPNTWFLTRRLFDRIGGYDERFSGWYGTDSEFRERVHTTARAVVLRSEVIVRYPREVIADASTTVYGRKEPMDRANVARIKKARAKLENWRPLRLTFPWERIL